MAGGDEPLLRRVGSWVALLGGPLRPFGGPLRSPAGKAQLPAPPVAPGPGEGEEGGGGRGASRCLLRLPPWPRPGEVGEAVRSRWDPLRMSLLVSGEMGFGPSWCPLRKSPLGTEGVWEARRLAGLADGSRGRAASLRAGKNIHFWNKLPGVEEMPCPLSLRRFKPNLGKKGWRDQHKEHSLPALWLSWARCYPPLPALMPVGNGIWLQTGLQLPFSKPCSGFFS